MVLYILLTNICYRYHIYICTQDYEYVSSVNHLPWTYSSPCYFLFGCVWLHVTSKWIYLRKCTCLCYLRLSVHASRTYKTSSNHGLQSRFHFLYKNMLIIAHSNELCIQWGNCLLTQGQMSLFIWWERGFCRSLHTGNPSQPSWLWIWFTSWGYYLYFSVHTPHLMPNVTGCGVNNLFCIMLMWWGKCGNNNVLVVGIWQGFMGI